LKTIDLEINPDFADFIEKVEKVDYLSDGEDVTLEPGESFEVLFKLKVGKLPNEEVDNFDAFGRDLARSQIVSRAPPSANRDTAKHKAGTVTSPVKGGKEETSQT